MRGMPHSQTLPIHVRYRGVNRTPWVHRSNDAIDPERTFHPTQVTQAVVCGAITFEAASGEPLVDIGPTNSTISRL